jgi:hypothetical protein
MKTHKIVIRIMVFFNFFISAFFLLLYNARIENSKLAGDLIRSDIPLPEINPVVEFLQWQGMNILIIFIAVLALVSAICLLVKKNWGRIISIVLGVILLPLGIYSFIENFMFTFEKDPSFWERVVEYFSYMGASLNYIDLGCIAYGLFTIIYFSRKVVITFTKQTMNSNVSVPTTN